MKEKICPRCGTKFICNQENITQCQCYSIKLTDNAKKYIKCNFSDCLCAKCMKEINNLTK